MQLFEIWLSPIETNKFKIIVPNSPVGEAEDESFLPFWDNGRDWRNTLIKILESPNGFSEETFPDLDERNWMIKCQLMDEDRRNFHPSHIKRIGQMLYESLLPVKNSNGVRQTFYSSLRIAEQEQTHLHICLKIDEKSARQSSIADYPWELLHDGQRFLLHHGVSLSRYIAGGAASPNLSTKEIIHILLVSSRATDDQLGLAALSNQEQKAIQNGLEHARDAGLIHLTRLPFPTQRALRAHLTNLSGEEAIPHVLHFDGHGIFGKRCINRECRAIHKGIKAEHCQSCGQRLPEAEGYLVFEDDRGGPDYVKASSLGTLLQSTALSDGDYHHEIALVVLSACQSAMALEGNSAFNGVAQSLVDHRIPAVVAMQYSIRADAASRFAEQFYRSLGRRNSLSIAIQQGREAMLEGNGHQWFRPALYLRWKDNEGGRLFADAPQKTAAVSSAETSALSPKTLLDVDSGKQPRSGQKIALLIGVSTYQEGFSPLPGSNKDVQAIEKVLSSSDYGGFDNVIPLLNPNSREAERAIREIFQGKSENDLVFLFFSGHGVKDSENRLYLAVKDTRKRSDGRLSNSLSAQFIHKVMDRCKSRQQVVVLDCCYSGAFPQGLIIKDDKSIDIRGQLGGDGRVILTSSTSMQSSFGREELGLSIYTRHFLDGILTGKADLDNDQIVSIGELHHYIKSKLKKVLPGMTPEIYTQGKGEDICLSKTLDSTSRKTVNLADLSSFYEVELDDENLLKSQYFTKAIYFFKISLVLLSLAFGLVRAECMVADHMIRNNVWFANWVRSKNHPQRTICSFAGDKLTR